MNNFYDKSNVCQLMASINDAPRVIGPMIVIPWNDCHGGGILTAYSAH